MNSRKGTLVLALILLLVGCWEFYRVRYRGNVVEMQSPLQTRGTVVFLGDGFPEPGIHQFYDDPTPQSVIRMTLPDIAFNNKKRAVLNAPLESGEGLELLTEKGQLIEVKRFWIPSEKRIALFIPLHPDHMSRSDWEALPGIGPRLAERIEENRQLNGDFGCLENLKRVKGVGEKRIRQLEKYF